MNDTFNISGGNINIAKDQGTAKQTNYTASNQDFVKELLNLLGEVKTQLPDLPREVRQEIGKEVEEAKIEVGKRQPDKMKIENKLNNAVRILKAVSATVTVATPIGILLGKTAVVCAKMAGL